MRVRVARPVRVRRLVAALVVAGALAACSPAASSPVDPGSSKKPSTSPPAASADPVATPVVPSASPAADVPGRPYDGQALLALMRTQQQPALDPSLVTDAVAAAMAEQVWTYDGTPYRQVMFEGSCESGACALGLTGLPSAAGDPSFADAYRWAVEPGASVLRTEGGWPSLSGYPHELDEALAEEARLLDAEGLLEGLQLSSVRWVPDLEDRVFELQFDDGLSQESVVYVRLNRSDRTLARSAG
ncbi:MAG TPA: hypothetical protein VFY23_02620 [Candidatus Limnocylindrales bacterium]|nr:hypothetical protein [Candidatus Limnocylindrales bacterium]